MTATELTKQPGVRITKKCCRSVLPHYIFSWGLGVRVSSLVSRVSSLVSMLGLVLILILIPTKFLHASSA